MAMSPRLPTRLSGGVGLCLCRLSFPCCPLIGQSGLHSQMAYSFLSLCLLPKMQGLCPRAVLWGPGTVLSIIAWLYFLSCRE